MNNTPTHKHSTSLLGTIITATLGLGLFNPGALAEPATASTQPAETASIRVSDSVALKAAIGKVSTVTGDIFRAQLSTSGKSFRITFKETKESGFISVIFPSNLRAFEDKLGADLPKLLEGKSVEITGKIVEYQGKPEIVLSDPTQLKVK